MLRVSFEAPDVPVVVRVFERDPSAIHRELAILELVRTTVPVPIVLHAEPSGLDGGRPFLILRFVEGITFHELISTGDVEAIQLAARSVGRTLAAIGRYAWPMTAVAWLNAPEPVNEADETLRSFDDLCQSTVLRERVGTRTLGHLHEFVTAWSGALAQVPEVPNLVHGDFRQANILVRWEAGRWEVAAILDWESASFGSFLRDAGVFLRYERSGSPLRAPHFSQGFAEAGGSLPDGWQQMARLYDLFSVCSRLRMQNLTDNVVNELRGVLEATAEDRHT